MSIFRALRSKLLREALTIEPVNAGAFNDDGIWQDNVWDTSRSVDAIVEPHSIERKDDEGGARVVGGIKAYVDVDEGLTAIVEGQSRGDVLIHHSIRYRVTSVKRWREYLEVEAEREDGQA